MMLVIGTAALLGSARPVTGPGQMPGACRNPAVTACTPQLVGLVQQLSQTLDSLAGLSTPADASAADRPTAVRFGTWLREASARLAAHAALARKGGSAPKPGAARLNYVLAAMTLRNRLLEEADRFSFTSNGLKARHEFAMNSIRNMK